MSPATTVEVQNPAIRNFLRSLNIVLKYARMYGMTHTQTIAQSGDSWERLQAVLSDGRKSGLQLSVSEGRLLVDGAPTKAGPAEQSFAQLLAAADLATVTFTPKARREAFGEMVRVIGENGAKPEGLAQKLKEALGDEAQSGIRINEIRFVAADSDRPESRVALELLAQTLGSESGQMQGLLDDPGKLLQFITAVDGSNQPTGFVSKTGGAAGSTEGPGTSVAGGTASATEVAEEETTDVIRLLSRLAREGDGGKVNPARLRQELSRMPQNIQATLHQALAEFAQSTAKKTPGSSMLLQVAEHLAIRLALDRYRKGDARVDAVTEMLGRMNQEIDSLRETVGSYEEKLKKAGFDLAQPANALEQEFWTRAPETAKLEALFSEEAWRVPSQHIRQFLDQLIEQNDREKLQRVLLNYVRCIHNSSPEARQKTAIGLKDLADYYSRAAGEPLGIAIRHVGEELAKERDLELEKLISGTFVLLGQEAATRRRYPAVLELISVLQLIERARPEMVSSLRARIGLENRIQDFLEEALRMPEVPAEMMELLRVMPLVAAEHVAGRMSRSARRRERDRLVKLAEELGPKAANALREAFRSRPPAAAVNAVGLLSRLDPVALEEMLRVRLPEWNRVYHDAVVRQIAAAGAPDRGRLLARLLDALDPLVAPLTVDEIGMSGDATTAPLILGIAGGQLPKLDTPYLRLKGIEALGRLRVREAIPLLLRLMESKETRHDSPLRELRVAAAQSLLKIDREGAKAVVSGAGFKPSDLEPMPFDRSNETPGVRQRYYPRMRLPRGLAARINTSDGELSATVRELSLGGGLCSCEQRMFAGTSATIRIKTGMRSFGARIIMRDARSEHVAFEIVDMDLDDRAKLRTLLQSLRR
jgi:PilZ domain